MKTTTIGRLQLGYDWSSDPVEHYFHQRTREHRPYCSLVGQVAQWS